MPMPRVTSGTAPSASVFNTLGAEVDALGVGCKVARTSSQAGIPHLTDLTVNWQAVHYDTTGTMVATSSPNLVTIRIDGVYAITLQQRWGTTAGGQRAGKIMINGTSVFTDSVASDKRAAETGGEGVTVSMTAVVPLVAGDLVYANYWQSSGSTITGLLADYGGTFMSLNRMGPFIL